MTEENLVHRIAGATGNLLRNYLSLYDTSARVTSTSPRVWLDYHGLAGQVGWEVGGDGLGLGRAVG